MQKEKTKFEKWFDALCYGFIIFAILYFGIRFMAGIIWGI